ncbi:MAG: hypothetical protein GKR89_22225 [Candidatus Latescibacteria bacterium]|nr:hypothetical protein [Candidatus Latescibacterota bacterium]
MSVQINMTTPQAPPHWALLQRQLLDAQTQACRQFYQRYFDERGYLLCVPRWGGDDGPDDAAENQLNWTMLHALGADDDILELFKKGWEGHLRQYTEAKTVEVPLARDGMYYKEFPVMFDWFHHGEGLSAFFLQGLSDPDDRLLAQRMQRFAGFYMNEDPQAQNYDPEHKIIRSLFNGSRGPLLRKATALDWTGDPIEVEGRFRLGHNESNYEEMLAHFRDYTDVVGDHPINLGATTLAFTAYALTGQDKYSQWLLEYVDAWAQRTAANNGIIPSNIGLDGSIGGACDGKWYGGCYGWGFTVKVPGSDKTASRPAVYSRAHYGFGNALLLTGQQHYVDVWRGVLDQVNAQAKEIDGQQMYPRMHGDDGWYGYSPHPFNSGALELYYWSQQAADRQRLEGHPWIDFLDGQRPDYPVQALHKDLETVRRRVGLMHDDNTSPDTRLSDDMNPINPAVVDSLNQLMLGGLTTGRTGFPLHCRLRYFDPERRRAGMPPAVAALVDGMGPDHVSVQLVNLDPLQERVLVVQGGAYAEHQLLSIDDGSGPTPVDGAHFTARLAPGSGARLNIKMDRYANRPTLVFPWNRS